MEEENRSLGEGLSLSPSESLSIQSAAEPLPPEVWIPKAILNFFIGVGKAVGGFLLGVVMAFWNIALTVAHFFTRGIKRLYRFFRSIGRKFKFNDVPGRVSFGVFGVSDFAHGRIANGIIKLVFEIGYLGVFIPFGIPAIGKLSTLGDFQGGEVCHIDELLEIEICQVVPPDNSLLILIFGILWIVSIALFVFFWIKSINDGYNNYRIANFDTYREMNEKVAPFSAEIHDDIIANELGVHGGKALMERYALVYQNALAKAETQLEKDYFGLVLNQTIEDDVDLYNDIRRLNKEKEKALAKKEAISSNTSYAEAHKQDVADSKAAAEAYEMADAAYQKALASGDEATIKEAKKVRHSAKLKSINVDSRMASRSMRQASRIDKENVKIERTNSLLKEKKDHALSYAEKESVQNHSRYGKFNRYYSRLASVNQQKVFYQNYAAIREAYDRGLKENDAINAENAKRREELNQSHAKRLEEIEAQYAGIAERRAKVEGERDVVIAAYQEAVLKAASLAPEEKAKAIAEAKAKRDYDLKTVKGKVLALPTKKEVKVAHREDVLNETQAYKRDYKGFKVDYTPEEFAEYSATNAMLVLYHIDYDSAHLFVKEVKENLSAEQVAAKLKEVEEVEASYVEKNPTKFDGKPATFKEQLRSLLDENFHLTMLFLPIIGVVIFTIMPLVLSILVAFTNYDHTHTPPDSMFTWAGFMNFVDLFNAPADSIYYGLGNGLRLTIVWTISWAIIATFSNYFLGIIYALMINKEGIKFKKFWRFIFTLSIAVPQFISLIGLSLMLSDSGALGSWFFEAFGRRLGFGTDTTNNALLTKVIIIIVNIWVGIPYTILQTTGILMNIPKDLYESSKIDGAGTVTQFFKITMPYIFFVTGPSLIQGFIGNINNFGVIYFLTGGGPTNNSVPGGLLGYTDLLVTYLYKLVTSATTANYGLASSIGILVFILCAFISMIMYNRSSSVKGEDQFQ